MWTAEARRRTATTSRLPAKWVGAPAVFRGENAVGDPVPLAFLSGDREVRARLSGYWRPRPGTLDRHRRRLQARRLRILGEMPNRKAMLCVVRPSVSSWRTAASRPVRLLVSRPGTGSHAAVLGRV